MSLNLSEPEEYSLIRRSQHGDKRARNKLIMFHKPFIRKEARKYNGYEADWYKEDDLVNQAFLGFINAIEKFDLTKHKNTDPKGNRLSSYAIRPIKESIQEFKRNGELIRIPQKKKRMLKEAQKEIRTLRQELEGNPNLSIVSEKVGIREDDLSLLRSCPSDEIIFLDYSTYDYYNITSVSSSDDGFTLEDELMLREETNNLLEFIKDLPEKEQKVVRMRYELNGSTEHTLREISQNLKCSIENVRKLEKKALDHLRERFYEKGYDKVTIHG